METKVSSASQEVLISDKLPTVLIGERINPTGKKKMTAALKAGEIEVVRNEAMEQVKAGADILDVNVVVPREDEVALLPQVLKALMETVQVPLCIDFSNPRALKEALKVYRGKPIINSVTGEEKSLTEILPLVKEYGAAVIGLTIDEHGIPKDSDGRLAIAHRIVERADALGIKPEDVIIDCLALTVGSDSNAGLVTIETIGRVKAELGVNQTLGASNISFGLPDRALINKAFLSITIAAGVTCPTVDAAKVRASVLAADLILGRDRFAQRFLTDFRQREQNRQG